MELSRRVRLILGIMSFWPPAYFVFNLLSEVTQNIPRESPEEGAGLSIGLIANLATLGLLLGLLIFSLVYLARDETQSRGQKIFWTIFLIVGQILAVPLFWMIHIRKRPSRSSEAIFHIYE